MWYLHRGQGQGQSMSVAALVMGGRLLCAQAQPALLTPAKASKCWLGRTQSPGHTPPPADSPLNAHLPAARPCNSSPVEHVEVIGLDGSTAGLGDDAPVELLVLGHQHVVLAGVVALQAGRGFGGVRGGQEQGECPRLGMAARGGWGGRDPRGPTDAALETPNQRCNLPQSIPRLGWPAAAPPWREATAPRGPWRCPPPSWPPPPPASSSGVCARLRGGGRGGGAQRGAGPQPGGRGRGAWRRCSQQALPGLPAALAHPEASACRRRAFHPGRRPP